MDNFHNDKELNFKFELNKSIFLIDILKDYYEFENKNKMILIFKKNNKKGTIKEEVSIDNLIYFVQIELPKIYPFLNFRKNWQIRDSEKTDLITRYQFCFGDIDTIKKLIDNIKYLNK